MANRAGPNNPNAEEPTPIASALDGVMRSLKRPTARASSGMFANWAEAVGDQIALHAQPVSLADGRLVVEVDQPGWATQLRFLEAELIERIRPFVGGVQLDSIEVKVRRQESSRKAP
jgi:predicted nucleic acid-binding Zn ribbon protein